MIENVLILDTETTGLHPDKGAQIIELGAILYNVKHKAILQQFSTLFPCETNPVEHINHISAELTKGKYMADHMKDALISMIANCDAFVAHNAPFDRNFLLADARMGDLFHSKPWICTQRDFKWPALLTRFRLQDVCGAMGIPYVEAHRALTDCNFIAQCFSKIDDLEERINFCVA